MAEHLCRLACHANNYGDVTYIFNKNNIEDTYPLDRFNYCPDCGKFLLKQLSSEEK